MTLKRKIILWSVIGLVCLSAGVTLLKRYFASKDSAEFVAQLRLARADGIPTSATEFASTFKPASTVENAASDYRSMGDPYPTDTSKQVDPFKAEWMLLNQPSPATLKSARAILLANPTALAFIDVATTKPRCWFNRNWSDGPAVDEPELRWMRKGARLVALRGAVELAQGHDEAAIANALEIFQMSKHAGEEGTGEAAPVSREIYVLGMRELVDLAFVHPIQPYINALNRAIESYPPPDLRAESRGTLFFELRGIDLLEIPEGQKKLGLKPEDMPGGPEVLAASFLSQPRAKVEIVKAERDYWAALKLPPKERDPLLSEAEDRVHNACRAFPMMYRYGSGGGRVADGDPDLRWEMTKQEYTAISRALAGGGRAKAIKTDDLKSPFDGVPLRYSFDGRQMTIEVSQSKNGGTTRMRIPANKPS